MRLILTFVLICCKVVNLYSQETIWPDKDQAYVYSTSYVFDISSKVGKKSKLYAVDFISKILFIKDAKYSTDKLSYKIPVNNDYKSEKIIQRLYTKLSYIQRVKVSKYKEVFPSWKIVFYPIAGGDVRYQAFNVKINQAFYREFEKTDHFYDELYKEGITIYVKKEDALKYGILISKLADRASQESVIQGNINLSPEKQYTTRIPKSGQYTLGIFPSNNAYFINGYLCLFNPIIGKYDTAKFDNFFDYNMSKLLDSANEEIKELSIKMFRYNHSISSELIKGNKLKAIQIYKEGLSLFKTINDQYLEGVDERITELPYKSRLVYFDPDESNFLRFKNSSCYEKLGFNPFMDIEKQELIYQQCEKESTAIKTKIGVFIIVFLLIILIGLYIHKMKTA